MILYTENPKDATQNNLSSLINLVNLQQVKLLYKNLLVFYTITINYQKKKLRTQSLLQLYKKNLCSETYEFKKTCSQKPM